MRASSTIWESASRPLFVRTVWLEGSEIRPGFQRHFLLDYETKRPTEQHKVSLNNSQRQKTANVLETSFSYDLESAEDSEDDLMLIDSAKAKLHNPIKPGISAKGQNKSCSTRRRPSFLSRTFQSYDNCSRHIGPRRSSNTSDFLSRRSSLQDVNCEKPIAANEKLAERVLNWLDLAGNEDFVKHLPELKDMEVKLTKTAKLRGDSIKRCLSKSANANNFNIPKLKTSKLKSASSFYQDAQSSLQNPHKSPSDAVKHITIIFDKEGQPIRLNRPAKNIDLCALSASPSTARRLAGSLASARLYKSAEVSRLNLDHKGHARLKEPPRLTYSARRRLDTVADLTTSNLQKRLQETPIMSSYHSLHDTRKQLHIFMPTLPKKGMTATTMNGCGGYEDGLSELSQNLSEYCKV